MSSDASAEPNVQPNAEPKSQPKSIDRRFRFGIVAGRAASAQEWRQLAAQAENLGFDTLLIPDTSGTLAPLIAATVAAAATTSLRVGSYVLAAPLRTPAMISWEARTVDLLTSGRFELGLGAGRPDAARDAETLGHRFGTPAERVALVEQTIVAVRGEATPQHPGPPILVAAAGRRLLSIGARLADIVALALPPEADDVALAQAVDTVRHAAGRRFGRLELSMNLVGLGEQTPPWLRHTTGADLRSLAAAGSVSVLSGTPRQMADQLLRRRDVHDVSYLTTNSAFIDDLARVVELLHGR